MAITPPTVAGTDVNGVMVSTAAAVNAALATMAGHVDDTNAAVTAQAAQMTAMQAAFDQKMADIARKLRRAGVY